jgi:hypothetical protein
MRNWGKETHKITCIRENEWTQNRSERNLKKLTTEPKRIKDNKMVTHWQSENANNEE